MRDSAPQFSVSAAKDGFNMGKKYPICKRWPEKWFVFTHSDVVYPMVRKRDCPKI
jgi:hypothetical protein